MAFLLTFLALILVSSFISLQILDISAAKSFCDNFSADFNIDTDKVSLKPGKGELIKGNVTNTGFENEFSISHRGADWVVVRPKIFQLDKNESGDVFVYMSPEFDARGDFDIRLIVDAACISLEKTIKASVQ